MSSPKPPPHPLSELPFLDAALEDSAIALRLAGEGGNSRQSVCLMHDALEFLFYQILSGREVDVYKSGQNTIGFDAALEKCKGQDIPLTSLTLIREIQKRRGDAKHHAQKPNPSEFERIAGGFRALFTVMCFENYGNSLATFVAARTQQPYHIALYDLYRRARRNQNWKTALPLALRALLHKRRAIYGAGEDYATHVKKAEDLLSILESTAKFAATSEEADKISALVKQVRQALSTGDMQTATEAVGSAFSQLDFVSPTIFDIKIARRLTDRLYQARSAAHIGMWSMEPNERLHSVFKDNPTLAKSFGEACYMGDEDSYSTWWEFVFFDGSRWLPFHLGTDFSISTDPSAMSGTASTRPRNFAELVADEFAKAARNQSESRPSSD
jgi:ribosomal protein S20